MGTIVSKVLSWRQDANKNSAHGWEKNLIWKGKSNKKCQAAKAFSVPGNRFSSLRALFLVPFSKPLNKCSRTSGRGKTWQSLSQLFSFSTTTLMFRTFTKGDKEENLPLVVEVDCIRFFLYFTFNTRYYGAFKVICIILNIHYAILWLLAFMWLITGIVSLILLSLY